MTPEPAGRHPAPDEERFRRAFVHLDAVAAYARRRGAPDPEAVAAEVLAIAWRRLDVVPPDDPLPWLLGTARRVVLAQRRSAARTSTLPAVADVASEPEVSILDHDVAAALRALAPVDREALLLVAWEGLDAPAAARVLGIRPTAFRVRLHRARRRFAAALAAVEDAAHPETLPALEALR